MDPKGRDEPGYRMHAFVCGHTRPEGSVRGCCVEKNSLDLMREFKIAAKERGIVDVRVQKSGCLDFCEAGPTCVLPKEIGSKSQRGNTKLVDYMEGGSLPEEFLLDIKA